MSKRASYTIITITIFILICILLIIFLQNSTIHSTNDLPQIDYQDTFTQSDQSYIVYFWQDSCGYCKDVEPDVVQFVSNGDMPIYLVDMQESINQSAWYDWNAHHLKYDKIIGKVIDGKQKFNEDVDLTAFENDTDIYWTFGINNDNEIIAAHNSAYGNTNPNNIDEIEITGTPTMIKIVDGSFVEYASGAEQVKELLQES